MKLSDICDYATDRTNISALNKSNYISTENMLPNKSGITVASTLPTTTQIPAYRIDDVLVSNIRPYFKKIWKANLDGGCSADVLVFRAKENVDSDFLYYVLSSDKFFEYSMATSKGTKMPRGDKKSIMEFEVPNFDFPTQKKIAEVLSCLDAQIELNRRINENLEQQAQAIFKEWFVDFGPFAGKMPNDWKEGYLDDIIEFINGYAFDSKSLLKEPKGECYDVFKQGHIKRGGGFNIDGTKSWFPKENASKLKKYVLKKGDILMAMTDMKGNVAILGNTAIMEVDDKYILNQRVGLLRCKKELGISFPYLYLLTNSFDFNNDLRQRANSGVQVNLSTEAIKKSRIYIAPKKINIQFDSLVKPLYEEMIHNDLESCNLAQIRDTLLPKLMSGEIKV